jgi:hypothetical protein
MAVVTQKSTSITNVDAGDLNPDYKSRGVLREAVDTIEVANGDSIASVYRMFRVWSGWRVSDIIVDSDDIGTTTAGDIGLYRTNAEGGAVVDADFFASALSLNGGALSGSNVTHESGVVDVANKGKRLWEQLGLTADPGVWYDVALTLTAAADAAGTFTLRGRFAE